MNRFEVTRQLFGKDITALVLCFDKGVHVSLYGGDAPHIGAVTIGDQTGICHTTQFPGHKEAVVSEQWSGALLQNGFCPAVVEAGIHYDNLSLSGIQAVLACTDEMLEACLRLLGQGA